MNNRHRIDVGDKVNVFWEHLEPLFNVEVTYTPQATGDCWHLFRPTDTTTIYVQTFCRMVKL